MFEFESEAIRILTVELMEWKSWGVSEPHNLASCFMALWKEQNVLSLHDLQFKLWSYASPFVVVHPRTERADNQGVVGALTHRMLEILDISANICPTAKPLTFTLLIGMVSVKFFCLTKFSIISINKFVCCKKVNILVVLARKSPKWNLFKPYYRHPESGGNRCRICHRPINRVTRFSEFCHQIRENL